MKYKALLLDIDGTIVNYNYSSLPSPAVVNAINKARTKLTVCLVTGRSHGFSQPILKALSMNSGYMVANNGAQVINLKTKKLLYDRTIELDDARKVVDIFDRENIRYFLKQEVFGTSYMFGYFKKDQKITSPYMFYVEEEYPLEKIETIQKQLSGMPMLSVYTSNHKLPDKYGLTACHINATKLHGIEVVIKELGIASCQTIGVGDSYNDFSLLMASGLKVAMGNAIEDLKAIADYIAPSVSQDGVADVIKRFVLASTPQRDPSS